MLKIHILTIICVRKNYYTSIILVLFLKVLFCVQINMQLQIYISIRIFNLSRIFQN